MERQAAHLHRKRMAEQHRAEAVVAERTAMMSARRQAHDIAHKESVSSENADLAAGKSFLQRVAGISLYTHRVPYHK